MTPVDQNIWEDQLAEREHSIQKHGVFTNHTTAYIAYKRESDEVEHAMLHEGEQELYNEIHDAINTLIKWAELMRRLNPDLRRTE